MALLLQGAMGCCSAGPGRSEPLVAAAYEEKVAALREDYRFTVVAVPPFVVVGGGPASEVRGYAQDVVGWAAAALRRELFEAHPSRIVTIWALRSTSSYMAWGTDVLGRAPSSPYGLYAPCSGAIVVNRSRGDGTLVHEMVHVLVEVDFPNAPTWLDEGLASLYEQPADREGRIVGLVNWRLGGLKRGLRRGTAPPLREVMESSRSAFYAKPAMHYAVARYLLFALQERGQLRRFYRAFRDSDDDTGIATLEAVTGEPLDRFERAWRRFVLAL